MPPLSWPGKWVREESFWREMTTRTLSGLLVAAVVALAAVFAGFGTHEQRMSILVSAGWIALIIVVASFLLVTQLYNPHRYLTSTRIRIFEDEYRIVPGDRDRVTVALYGDTTKTEKLWNEHQEEIKANLREATGIDPNKAKFKKKNVVSDLLTFDLAGPVFYFTGFDMNTFTFGEPDPNQKSFAFGGEQRDSDETGKT